MKKHLLSAAGMALATGLVVSAAHAQSVPAAAPAATAAGSSTREGATASTVTTQLPRAVRPLHYDLTLEPDPGALTFKSKVAITVEVVEATANIVLQAKDLTFGEARLSSEAGKAVGPNKGKATVTVDDSTQTASFAFAKPLAPGRYVLTIDYAGKINTQAFGLFALDYKAADGSQKRALYTQFENSDARRFMPSWDEPFYKATFRLKAIVPEGEMAIGNLPAESTVPAGKGKVLVTFGESPKMSTYLLFFSLGDFERESRKVGNTEVSVVTKRGDLAQAQFALDEASKMLPWMNEYFGAPFPLPRLDNIAAPGRSQFFSAMENWGAIFYFENAMLLDPKTASTAARERISTVVAHEMAHQWFGDLVTMSWWDDLWLNEGFASWLESRTTEVFHPEWQPELTAVNGREAAMGQDAFVSTHPIIHHVSTVEEASQAFDGITYSKGEAVIRMLEAYAGADPWRDGVRAYVARYAHGNTVTDDLWAEIERTSGKPITRIAHDFTLQPGIPLVKASASCAKGVTTLSLSQDEFTRDRPGKKALAWQVPVNVSAIGGGSAQTLLQGAGSIEVKGCGPVVVNAGQTGYFRVLYDKASFAALSKNFGSVASVDQLGVLNDVFALGITGQQNMGATLDLIRALPADAAPAVLSRAARITAGLADYARGDEKLKASLSRFASAKFLPVLNNLGWTPRADEPAIAGNLRAALIDVLGSLGEPSVVAEARRRFEASRTDPAALDSSVRVPVMGVVAANVDAAGWDALRAMAKGESSAQFRDTLYALLGQARDPALADKALALALTDEPGATTTPVIISAVSGEHPDKAFDFVLANYDTVMGRLDSASATRFLGRLATGSSDPAMIEKLEAYAKARLAPSARRPVDEAISRIKDRIRVRDARMGEVRAWLAANAR